MVFVDKPEDMGPLGRLRCRWKDNINLQAPCILYIRTGVSLLSRECFLYIWSTNIFHYL